MAQPYKGDRVQIMARLHRTVYDIVKRESTDRGMPMGQFVADVVAMAVGHPEVVRELDKEVLPLAV